SGWALDPLYRMAGRSCARTTHGSFWYWPHADRVHVSIGSILGGAARCDHPLDARLNTEKRLSGLAPPGSFLPIARYNQGMTTRVSDEALDILFRRARTFITWLDKPVPEELLRGIYDVMKWGPTSVNGCPVRILFLRTKAAKERLRPALAPGNLQQT